VIKNFEIHGLAHITGGGLMKLQRITKHGFDIFNPLEPQPVFKFLQKEGKVDDIEMYKTFNMEWVLLWLRQANLHRILQKH